MLSNASLLIKKKRVGWRREKSEIGYYYNNYFGITVLFCHDNKLFWTCYYYITFDHNKQPEKFKIICNFFRWKIKPQINLHTFWFAFKNFKLYLARSTPVPGLLARSCFSLLPRPVVLSQKWFCLSRDLWQCLDTVNYCHNWGENATGI